VTLDDVAAILRLPVEGTFFTWVPYSSDDAQKVLVGELDMTEYEAEQEITIVRGPSIRLDTLKDIMEERAVSRNAGDQEIAAKVPPLASLQHYLR
jgi:hypothetical protein